ncbi:MAG TPA: methyltransferase domain-containing protein, partial [Anaerolineales bacterium]|nr:methyltransferase domain-containing protein [Anaerolineales bacterium]
AIWEHAAPATITACDPSPGFIEFARRSLSHPEINFEVAGTAELPRHAGGFDAAAAGLVLNFLPDPGAAVAAMGERLKPGGWLAGYVWDYAEGMQFIKRFWEAAAEMDPRAAELDEGPRFPLCHPPALAALLEEAGLERVEVGALEIETHFADFEDYWRPFLGGTGPGPAYVAALEADAREALRLRLRQELSPNADGPVRLSARAWAVRGARGS